MSRKLFFVTPGSIADRAAKNFRHAEEVFDKSRVKRDDVKTTTLDYDDYDNDKYDENNDGHDENNDDDDDDDDYEVSVTNCIR